MRVRRLGEGSSNKTYDYKNSSIENNFLIKFQNFCRKHLLVNLYMKIKSPKMHRIVNTFRLIGLIYFKYMKKSEKMCDTIDYPRSIILASCRFPFAIHYLRCVIHSNRRITDRRIYILNYIFHYGGNSLNKEQRPPPPHYIQ